MSWCLAVAFASGCLHCGDARPDKGSHGDTNGGQTSDVPPPMLTVLIDQTLWQQLDEVDDPLADHRPENAYCSAEGTLLHSTGTFDVLMDFCSYFMGSQPTLAPIAPGDCIEIPFQYGDLISPEGSYAHVALLLGGEIIWELNVPIPSPSRPAYGYWMATSALPAGTPIAYHVHNHGPNQYVLGDVAILPLEPGQSCPPGPG